MSPNNSHQWWRRLGLWEVVSVLLLGQAVSIILALINFTASLTANLGANSPVTLSLFGYLSLTLVYGSILLYQRHELIIPWYWYALIAFFDVQDNYLYNSAYYFSSITRVALLDCWTVGWVILLGTKYSLWQFLGAALCGVGLCLVFLSDVGVGGGGGSNPLLGDMLVIVGALFFALSNVGEEFCVKKNRQLEVLAMLDVFGMFFCLIEIAIFERKNLEVVTWSTELILTFVGYTVGFFMFYSTTALMLKSSGSALFNLSLLTADMWAVIIRIFSTTKSEKNPNQSQEPENGYSNPQYQLVHEQGIETPSASS